ncbi:F420-dependent NADP oxidoreductase [Microbulbifer thermotolerans]|uniref:F420-dependent NADP oxidoreductase n=1 Tax=Microbulbifer thermotolerans TaxID=252514 RepID=A0AB35HVX1_MICTH|nr:Rossmann-like and DUF2520 domain-containing protein [Microbulbifer thermotolerans]MCX2781896.1 F420-dependent NADP oxidoreductase [Microbulbifer thermotolerans]MCX2793718.1 F420-dependent NADP oxidoreductase [Microbulbifer thermotolerans]MCX2800902.1 F420-dependent NADP oxidoreductase [Microbulbifer thermotolerans]MCX2834730.1 F420-dependent NADP oxidoreductase [Microbulbifer thermotolerans]MCX2841155.1 F420-dependent NADP oxidoreductase [Microbulbifer thermotolerans]
MPTLNIIGAGRLGKTLARLWQRQGIFQIGAVCNRSLESAVSACRFIGAGTPCPSVETMADADCWLIASGDGQIAAIATQLAPRLSNSTMVFHCSGALSSSTLSPCKPAAVASAHPVHSFADPERSVATLAGSCVALEGDQRAIEHLSKAFSAIGCTPLTIAPEHKVLYHAGSVFACNYLTALMELSLRAFSAAGIDRQQALKLLKPIVLQTAENNMHLGPEKSLTGPIARGDAETVAAQLSSLQSTDTQLANCYRQLGQVCVELARRCQLPEETAARLTEVLREPSEKI